MGDIFNYLNSFLAGVFKAIYTFILPVIGNNGLAIGFSIVLFTILIRIILLPLNIGQIRSSYKMQELQPEMKKLQEKYKSDPKKSQQEVMNLYKEHGVNPLGGCLPMLVQWPVLIAMYSVFNNLQANGFIIQGVHFLWVQDLSKPHDIILVAISGLTTYLSMAVMTPKQKDSQVANTTGTMTITMTALMTWFSYNFSAALVIYWIVGNLFMMTQTVVIRKIDQKIIVEHSNKG